jgi:hypothetical protein
VQSSTAILKNRIKEMILGKRVGTNKNIT